MLAGGSVHTPGFLNQVVKPVTPFHEAPQGIPRAGRIRRLELLCLLGYDKGGGQNEAGRNQEQADSQ
jgi:hypothetical protein